VHNDARPLEANRSALHVPVESASSLQQQIDGRQVRVQLIEVEIQALLDDLRRDEDAPTAPRSPTEIF
jgi:hypothetical protein